MDLSAIKYKSNVWELNPAEIDFIYKHLHMNEYVHIALNIYHGHTYPVGRKVTVKNGTVPDYLLNETNELLNLIQYINCYDPHLVRINCTFRIFKLFYKLKDVKYTDIDIVISLLASLAFIPIITEKNDNLLIWKKSIIREITPELQLAFDMLCNGTEVTKFNDFLEKKRKERINNKSPVDHLFMFSPNAMECIIPQIENGNSFERISNAFINAENAMHLYERSNNLGSPRFEGGIKHKGQMRYRNTLYLYGGNYFEHNRKIEIAYKWYTKDLLFIKLPEFFEFYLPALKTCERLICGYRASFNPHEALLYKNLIVGSLIKAFHNASDYAYRLFIFLKSNPNADLSCERIEIEKDKYWLYAGEACREIFLICALYKQVISNSDFSKMDYKEFFSYHT